MPENKDYERGYWDGRRVCLDFLMSRIKRGADPREAIEELLKLTQEVMRGMEDVDGND